MSTSDTPIINHKEAFELAVLKQSESNLARCYVDLQAQLNATRAELAERKPQPSGDEQAAGIYVASRVWHAEMWQKFRAQGYAINSTWIDEAGEGDTDDFNELWLRIQGEIRRSKALVLFVNEDDFPLKGALIETGMALAMGKPVFLRTNAVLEGRTMRPLGSWILDKRVTHCYSVVQAIELALEAGNDK